MKRTRDSAGLIAILILLAFLVERSLGCASRAAKEAAAETTYIGQQMDCVEKFGVKQDIEDCRNAVKARWSVKDAGGDR